MRILAVDFGEKRVGLALSDPLGITAQGLPSLPGEDPETVLQEIRRICRERSVAECVVGLPLMMSGEKGSKAREVLEWADELRKHIECPVRTWDERLTSKEAHRLMIAQDLSRRKQKQKSDQLAAILILQNYLDFKNLNKGSGAPESEHFI